MNAHPLLLPTKIRLSGMVLGMRPDVKDTEVSVAFHAAGPIPLAVCFAGAATLQFEHVYEPQPMGSPARARPAGGHFPNRTGRAAPRKRRKGA